MGDDRAATHAELRALVDAGDARAGEAEAMARELIAKNPRHNIARYSPGGKQTLATLELAHHVVADALLHRTRSREGLAEALNLAEDGLRLEHERPDWLVDTTARILLALGRTNDAFVLIEDAKRRFPKTKCFDDLEDKRAAWAAARTPAHDPRAITASFQKKARVGETFADIINRSNRWLRALQDAGWRAMVEVALGEATVALDRVHEPITPTEVRAIEEELGFSLPPSYARFLTEVGGLAFLNPWRDETTPPHDLVTRSRAIAELDMPNDEVWQSTSDVGVVRVCDHHNGEDWIYLCHFRDHRGEAPTFLRYHDEGTLAHGWELAELAAVVAGVAPRASEGGGGEAELANALSAALADEGPSQREKLEQLKGKWAPRLKEASDEDLLAALHAIRRSIKSKKVSAERDSLVGELRRDGKPGDAPLPSLDASLRPKKEAPPTPAAPEFETFHQWLSGRVDEMMDDVVDRVAPRE